MKKIKTTIIFTTIIVVILLISIFVLKLYDSKTKDEKLIPIKINKNLVQLNSKTSYFDVKNCINQYYQSLEQSSFEYMGDEEELNEEYIVEKYKSLLDEQYIKEFRITKENILNFYKNNNNIEFVIDNIYKKDYTENLSLYFIYGRNVNYNTNKLKQTGLIVKIDTKNEAFSIFPYEYMIKKNLEEKDLYKNVNTIKEIKEIKINDYNNFINENSSDELVVREYLNKFKMDIQYNPEIIYDMLDEKYKKENFKNKAEFLEKVESLKSKMSQSELKDYAVEKNDNQTIYKCVDTEGTYYIFKEKSILDYTIYLDFGI